MRRISQLALLVQCNLSYATEMPLMTTTDKQKGLAACRRKSFSRNKYRRRDLNPHSLYGYWILSPARLPFRHSGIVETLP